MNRKIKLTAAALAAVSLLTLTPISASAASAESVHTESEMNEELGRARITRYEISVSKVYNKSIYAWQSGSLTLGGKRISADIRIINGVPYADVEALFSELGGMSFTYRNNGKTLNVRGKNFEMDVIDGSNVVYANGRTLFAMTPSALMSNGKIYAPISSLAKTQGLKYSYNASTLSVTLSGKASPITHGSRYYREDAVYWLARIISAESRGESLLGQIAVGSVVLNRVNSSEYPNTIWGVIFDKKYGVQFSPISNGSIYNTPTSTAITAAKICLDGFNVNNSALFFLYPSHSSSSWIPNNREYLFSVGKHDFYA